MINTDYVYKIYTQVSEKISEKYYVYGGRRGGGDREICHFYEMGSQKVWQPLHYNKLSF